MSMLANVDLISYKWVYKVKHKSDRSIDHYKTCSKGCFFSSMAKMIYVKMKIALAANLKWNFWQLDMKNAFIDEGIFISQTSYLKKIIVRFGISKIKKVSTSLDVNIKLSGSDGKSFFDPRSFRALIGSLIYLIIIRPYITFSIGLVTFYAISKGAIS
ncbi:unnamed protein product [Musa hybrid cultivar]